jgi:hypothetical protein
MSLMSPELQERLTAAPMERQEDSPFYGVVRLTGALAIPESIQARMLEDIVEALRHVYPDLSAEAAAIDKIRTEPWCPDGVLARLAKWSATKRKALHAACERYKVPQAGLGILVTGQ